MHRGEKTSTPLTPSTKRKNRVEAEGGWDVAFIEGGSIRSGWSHQPGLKVCATPRGYGQTFSPGWWLQLGRMPPYQPGCMPPGPVPARTGTRASISLGWWRNQD